MARKMQPMFSSEQGDGIAKSCAENAPMHRSAGLSDHRCAVSQIKRRAQPVRLSWNAPLQAVVLAALLMCNPASCGKVHLLP